MITASGHAREADRRRVAEAAFELLLTKPVDPRELVLAVRTCVDGQAASFVDARTKTA